MENILQRIRKRNGDLTQYAIAKLKGCQVVQVQCYENGASCKIETIAEYARLVKDQEILDLLNQLDNLLNIKNNG